MMKRFPFRKRQVKSLVSGAVGGSTTFSTAAACILPGGSSVENIPKNSIASKNPEYPSSSVDVSLSLSPDLSNEVEQIYSEIDSFRGPRQTDANFSIVKDLSSKSLHDDALNQDLRLQPIYSKPIKNKSKKNLEFREEVTSDDCQNELKTLNKTTIDITDVIKLSSETFNQRSSSSQNVTVSKKYWHEMTGQMNEISLENNELKKQLNVFKQNIASMESKNLKQVSHLERINEDLIATQMQNEKLISNLKKDIAKLKIDLETTNDKISDAVPKTLHNQMLQECSSLLDELKKRQKNTEQQLENKLQRSEEERRMLACDISKLAAEFKAQQAFIPHLSSAYETAVRNLLQFQLVMGTFPQRMDNTSRLKQIIDKNVESQALIQKLCRRLLDFSTASKNS